MSEKRRDNRGRILHTGEVQLSTGQYRYKYVDNYGDERYCYNWRLDHNDRMPAGKKHTESLREMEKKIEADQFDHIVVNGGKFNVLELVEKYISVKTGVRPTTMAGYGTVINLLKKDPFGRKSGMNPKALQYLMGHSDISVTLNVYTHVKFEDAKAEIERIAND